VSRVLNPEERAQRDATRDKERQECCDSGRTVSRVLNPEERVQRDAEASGAQASQPMVTDGIHRHLTGAAKAGLTKSLSRIRKHTSRMGGDA
jgi:hypothetical protein